MMSSLREQVGALLVHGIRTHEVSDALIDHLRGICAQNLILFSEAFESPEHVRHFLSQIEEALGRRLLVMVDHEGGRIQRFRKGFLALPSALSLAEQGTKAVEVLAALEAEQLCRAGVQVNLAPCVDVLCEGSDPVIGDRSYGANPGRVSELARARIQGLQQKGIAACAKHFPGLGAVPKDPHRQLPSISLDWETMRAVHLVPFQAAIEAGVATVMSSHVCYPALTREPGLPATCAPSLIQGLLRDELGFSGLIISDDCAMEGLASFGDMAARSEAAIRAGHDLVLVCDTWQNQRLAFEGLMDRYSHNILKIKELNKSLERLDQLRQNFHPALDGAP